MDREQRDPPTTSLEHQSAKARAAWPSPQRLVESPTWREREREQQAEAGLWALNGKARPVVCVAAATRTCPNHTAERAGGAGMQDTSQSAARPKAQRHTLTRTRTHAHRHTSRPKHTHPHATPTRAHGTTAHSTRAHTASRTYRAGRTCPRITPATRTQDTGSEGGASQHSPGSGRGALCPPPST